MQEEGPIEEGLRAHPANKILLLAITVAGILSRLVCTTGLIGSDDLVYSHYAQQISFLHYTPESIHYALRYGLIVPVAFVYRVLGVHEWTTFLLPLLASAASVPLLMLVGARLVNVRGALVAGALLASFPVALLYATILVPEPVAGFYILLAMWLYTETELNRPLLLSCCTGAILGVAYVTKESAAFVAVAVFLDAMLRRRWKVAAGIAAGVIVILAVELSYYLVATGDVLYRFHAMKIHEATPMVLIANQNLKYRLLKSYPRMMILPNLSFGLHSIVALVAVLGLFKWRPPRVQLLLLWAVVPWLYLNFGSSSLTHYTALPVGDRYLEFCYAPLFLIAGFVLDRCLTERPRMSRLTFAGLSLVLAAGLWCGWSMHQQGWMTGDIAVLRRIAESAEHKHLRRVSYVDDPDHRWQQSLFILALGLVATDQPAGADLVIAPDALGLPSARSTAANTGKWPPEQGLP